MGEIASQITSLTIVYSTVYSDADQKKHQSSASLAFVGGIHRGPVNPRTNGQLRGKCFHLITSLCQECFFLGGIIARRHGHVFRMALHNEGDWRMETWQRARRASCHVSIRQSPSCVMPFWTHAKCLLAFISYLLRTTRHHNIANFGYPTPQHREQTTRDDILIGTDLLGQLQSHVGERTSFSGVNPEKKTENGKPLEQQIAHCNR